MVTIDEIEVQGFASLYHVVLKLSPITALVGRNDTGKSNILKAFELLGAIASKPTFAEAFDTCGGIENCSFHGRYWDGISFRVKGTVKAPSNAGPFHYHLKVLKPSSATEIELVSEEVEIPGAGQARHLRDSIAVSGVSYRDRNVSGSLLASAGRKASHPSIDRWLASDALAELRDAFSHLHILALRPERLAAPVEPSAAPEFRSDGFGLAAVLDAMVADPSLRDGFTRLEQHLVRLVPYINSVGTRVQPAGGSAKEIQFVSRFGGRDFPFSAARASDGLLLLLAFLALAEGPQRAPLSILEEPENGIHVARLAEVVDAFRTASSAHIGNKLLFTTHSPYLLDQLQPSEVRIVTRDAYGATIVTPLEEFTELHEWLKGFTLGEMWKYLGEERLASNGETSISDRQ